MRPIWSASPAGMMRIPLIRSEAQDAFNRKPLRPILREQPNVTWKRCGFGVQLIASLNLPAHRTRLAEVPSPPPLFVITADPASAESPTEEQDATSGFVAYILHLTGIRETLDEWATYDSPPVEQSRLLGARPACLVCGRSPDVLCSRDPHLLRRVNPFAEFRCAEHLDE